MDVRGTTTLAFFATADGGTSADVSFEATADPAGRDGWELLAVRTADDGTYFTTATTVNDGDSVSLYADITVRPTFVRAVVTNQTGPTDLYVVLVAER